MFDPIFTPHLACPNCKGPLQPADPGLIARLNREIQDKVLKNKRGTVVELAIQSGLFCEKDWQVFPIRDQIPLMLNDEALQVI